MDQTNVEWCAQCQISWAQAQGYAHSLEALCRDKPCPFKVRLQRRREEIGGDVFRVKACERVLEGSDFALHWTYKGPEVEWIELKGYGKIHHTNPVTIRAAKIDEVLSFSIKIKGYQDVIRKRFRVPVTALPRIVLANCPTIIKKGSSVVIRAELQNVSNALIQFPKTGRSYGFSGSFTTGELNEDLCFIIKAFGALDSIASVRHTIAVYQPPIIRRFRLKNSTMPRDNVVVFFEKRFGCHGEMRLRNIESRTWGNLHRFDANQMAQGFCKLKLPPGKYQIQLAVYGKIKGSIVESDIRNLHVKERALVRFLKGLCALVGVLVAMACVGAVLYWSWPFLEILFYIIVTVLQVLWSILTWPWTYVIIAYFWIRIVTDP